MRLADLAAYTAAALAVAFVVAYYRSIQRVRVGEDRWRNHSLLGASTLCGAVALALSPGLTGRSLAATCVLLGVIFAGLYAMRRQSGQGPAFQVGDPLPAFTATDENAAGFDSRALQGRPVLIKFFRGHW